MEIKNIFNDKGNLVAIVIPHNFESKGVNFLTNSKMNFQLAVINKKKNDFIEKHIHPKVERKIKQTSEFIFIKKGELDIAFFTDDNKLIERLVLKTGDAILIFSGVHSIKFIENTELIEVRQGPYKEGFDKIYIKE